MSGEHNDPALLVLSDDIPGEAAAVGVHTRSGLVQEDDARIADKSDPDWELSSLPSAELVRVHLWYDEGMMKVWLRYGEGMMKVWWRYDEGMVKVRWDYD